MSKRRPHMHTRLILPVVLLGLVGLAGCDRSPRLVSGGCSEVLGAEVCTWAVLDDGEVMELGATIPLSSIEAAPLVGDMVWPSRSLAALRFPSEAREITGFDHLGLNWAPVGHEPQLFLTPHFDFHFYLITPEVASVIDCTDNAKPSRLPGGYVLPDVHVPGMDPLIGMCVPAMGMHAMPEEESRQTQLFNDEQKRPLWGASMLMGYYGGEMVFVEPMVARELLLEESDFSLGVPVDLAGIPPGVQLPTLFRAEYDRTLREYRLTLTGFPTR